MSHDPLLARIIPVLAGVPGVAAIVLGGSRARGTALEASDTDLGLYYRDNAAPDIDRLRAVVTGLVDDPTAAHVTPVGGWGPWIIGGAWLAIGGRKVDLLYRSIDQVTMVIDACRNGEVSMPTSRAIRTASARRSGWARLRCAVPCMIPMASSRR